MTRPKSITFGGHLYALASAAYDQCRQAIDRMADEATTDIRERTGGVARDEWIKKIRALADELERKYSSQMSEPERVSLASHVFKRVTSLPLLADDPARPGVIHRDVRPEPVTRRFPRPIFPPMKVNIND